MNKLDTIKEKVNAAEDFSRKIWLAGLGAYGKSYEEVVGRIENLNTESTKVFDSLVTKGEKLEAKGKEIIKDKADFNVNSRVNEIREKLGMNAKGTDERISELSAKIDTLTEVVTKLVATPAKRATKTAAKS